MNLSKIITASALATSMAFAQEDAWPAEEQSEDQVTEQAEESTEQQEEPAAQAEASTSEDSKQEEPVKEQASVETNEQANVNNTTAMDEPNKPSTINSKAGFGVHADFNYSTLYGLAQDWNMGDEEDAPAGIGFDFGIRGRIPLVKFLQFVPEINFHYAALTQQDETAERTFTQMDLEIPLAMRGVVMDKFYIAAGVQLSLNLSSEVELEEKDVELGGGLGTMNMSFEEDIKQAGFGFGITVGVGGIIMERFTIDASLVLGLTNIYPDCESVLIDTDGAKQMTFKVGAGFWFM